MAGHEVVRMLDFGQFDFGQFDFGQLAEIELAEVEIGRSRYLLAEVEQMVFALFLLSLFLVFLLLCLFTFLYFFLVLTHLSLHFVFVLFLFSSEKPELNPKPRTLHPIADGPFRWTTLRWTTLRDNAPPGRPKFRSFFPPPATIFVLLSLSWGPFVEFCWCF